MNSNIAHIYLYISDLEKSREFYKEFLEILGYTEIVNEDWGCAFEKDDSSIWLEQVTEEYIKDGYHRKRIGLNHLAFRVDSKEDVDRFAEEFIKKNSIETLYDTPKPFPKYGGDYYAVFFEDPDRIKLEVTYYEI
jgi:catechol 2,3-dioxygenase-like lactoylglutathione lyase family enzyme